MLRTFIQVLALTAVLMSSFFLIRATIKLSIKEIAQLSTTIVSYNEDTAKNYCRQRADTVVGFSLLLLSFALQIGNLLWALRWCDFKVNKAGVIIALIASIVILSVSIALSNHLYNIQYRQVEGILKEIE